MACAGCGGLVPDGEGPTHPYMVASPGCWRMYGELVADWQGSDAGGGVGAARWHHVDAYAVQHPGGAERDRRQRQSVAVHLVTLCLLLEGGQPPERAPARRGRTSRVVLGRLGLEDWPYLIPPRGPGAVTVADVAAASAAGELEDRARAWLESAWAAWEPHHGTVRSWAGIVQGAGR